ncbi:MAG: DNA polymerase III subunit delta [Elusimicrobia bacterium]|nr:DNA polymerase III subunit delta [Elusimicrobiota bacterium]
MSLLRYRDFKTRLKTIKKSEISPVYLFYGHDDYLKNEVVASIEKIILSSSAKDLNYNVFHLPDDLPIDKALQSANAYPFASEKKLIIIKNIHKLPASQDSFLEDYVENPSKTCCLVLIGSDKIPKRTVFSKIEKIFPTVNFYHLYERDICQWVIEEFKMLKKDIDYTAVQTLFNITGDNIADIKNEIDKLVLYVGEKSVISVTDVENCCGHFKENTVFELIPVLARKDVKTAIRILTNLFNSGESEFAIIASLTGRYRQYLRFYEIIETGVDEWEATTRVGVRFYREKFLNDVRLLAKEDVDLALRKILDSELRMKTGANSRLQVEKLFFELCLPRSRAVHGLPD